MASGARLLLEPVLEGPRAAPLHEIEDLRGAGGRGTQVEQLVVDIALVGEEIGLDGEVQLSAHRLDVGDRFAQAVRRRFFVSARALDEGEVVKRLPALLGGAELLRKRERRLELAPRRVHLPFPVPGLAEIEVRLHRLATVLGFLREPERLRERFLRSVEILEIEGADDTDVLEHADLAVRVLLLGEEVLRGAVGLERLHRILEAPVEDPEIAEQPPLLARGERIGRAAQLRVQIDGLLLAAEPLVEHREIGEGDPPPPRGPRLARGLVDLLQRVPERMERLQVPRLVVVHVADVVQFLDLALAVPTHPGERERLLEAFQGFRIRAPVEVGEPHALHSECPSRVVSQRAIDRRGLAGPRGCAPIVALGQGTLMEGEQRTRLPRAVLRARLPRVREAQGRQQRKGQRRASHGSASDGITGRTEPVASFPARPRTCTG